MKLLSARSARDDEGDAGGYVAIVSALYAEHALGLAQVVGPNLDTYPSPLSAMDWSVRSPMDEFVVQ
jgi:hypothetical protein